MTQECYQQSICNPEPFVGWKQLETIYVKPNIFQEKLSQKKTELLCRAITRFNFECRKISRIEWTKETNGYLITHVRINKLATNEKTILGKISRTKESKSGDQIYVHKGWKNEWTRKKRRKEEGSRVCRIMPA